ncbi:MULTISPECIES: sugar ABC transporter ATP-binding protein [unclassified Roseitalea]|uniref:sugar ABC transporter ATP-binding protein n=1 Tax=unclassified Roseitalea TaxID=2639107 RepID=UPI00273F5122|nr:MULTISPECIES: sugar ABC transporter ATP-binding protein [unclassified Roseitalea]
MTAVVETSALTKHYGNVVALDDFTHLFEKSRIHALMGKNGSGKSTLVKMLSGVVQPTAGQIALGGMPVRFKSPSDAFAANVVTVHQELSLVPELSVAENIFLGRLPQRTVLGVSGIDWPGAMRRTEQLLTAMGLDIDPHAQVRRLSVGQQQTVEIAKAMSFSPALLLLDEPTSALASREVEMLFELLRRLRESGVTMMYITHRMSELAEIADTVTVLRDGRHAGSVEMARSSSEEIIDMMFGDVARATHPGRRLHDPAAEPVLSVRGLTRQGAFEDVSFDLFPGEVLGIAGMLGAGRTELLRAIFGADPFDAGQIVIDGKPVEKPDPRAMTRIGLGYTPENRKEVGLVQAHSIHANLSMASLRRNAVKGIVTRAAERPGVERQVEQLHIKIGSADDAVSSLSGGNQQKVVIGNWLNTDPKVMFFDEPSRGVDVHAKQQIFQIIWEQARKGVSAVFVSTELEELLDVCDRVLVMKQGRMLGELDPAETTLSQLYIACMEGL